MMGSQVAVASVPHTLKLQHFSALLLQPLREEHLLHELLDTLLGMLLALSQNAALTASASATTSASTSAQRPRGQRQRQRRGRRHRPGAPGVVLCELRGGPEAHQEEGRAPGEEEAGEDGAREGATTALEPLDSATEPLTPASLRLLLTGVLHFLLEAARTFHPTAALLRRTESIHTLVDLYFHLAL